MVSRTVFVHASPEKVVNQSEQVFKRFGWKLWTVDRSKGTIEAGTRPTWLSWGEKVIVRLTRDSNGTTVTISSVPSGQLFDWGKSEANVKRFTEELENELRPQPGIRGP